MKVAAYCRVSTDHDDQINSLESQKRYFEDYIRRNDNWQFVNIYADEGISGTQAKKRPAFMQMIEDAGNKEIDLILTKEISRFARNTLDSLQYTRQLKNNGVGVIFINDNINTLDPDAELRLTIMSSIAQEEIRKTSERVKWGQKRRMELGVVFGNGVLGYNLSKGKLTVNDEEAEIVRIIFNKYTIEGKGVNTISRELHGLGYKTKYNTSWSVNGIFNILRNEKYVGDLLQKKYFTPNYLEHKKIINKSDEDTVYISNHHEAIISRDLWQKTQDELERRSPKKKELFSKYSNRHWFSGKIQCGKCKSRYVLKTRKMQYGIYKVLLCNNSSRYGIKKIDAQGNQFGCDSGGVNYKTIITCINYVFDLLLKNRKGLLDQLETDLKNILQKSNDVDVNALLKKKKLAEERKEKLVDLYVTNVLTLDELKSSKKKYEDEISYCDNQIYNHKNSQSLFDKEIVKIIEVFQNLPKKDLLDEEVAEEIYRSGLEKIVIYSDFITVKLKDLPIIVRLYYQVKGKKERYETTIIKHEFI